MVHLLVLTWYICKLFSSLIEAVQCGNFGLARNVPRSPPLQDHPKNLPSATWPPGPLSYTLAPQQFLINKGWSDVMDGSLSIGSYPIDWFISSYSFHIFACVCPMSPSGDRYSNNRNGVAVRMITTVLQRSIQCSQMKISKLLSIMAHTLHINLISLQVSIYRCLIRLLSSRH